MTFSASRFSQSSSLCRAASIHADDATATLTRRQFGLLFVAAAGAIGLPLLKPTSTGAQDATASATPIASSYGEYPELKITSTDTGMTLPTTIEAGRYLVTIDNQATLGESVPNFILLPEGQTADEVLNGPANPATGMPGWFYDAALVGAPITPAGTTAQAIVDFAPGNYAVVGESFQPSTTLEVVLGPNATPIEPQPEATITIGDGVLSGVPALVTTGSHLWQITVQGDVPHRFQLYGFPEPLTLDQLIAAYTHSVEGTTPEPGLPDLALVVQLSGLGPQSSGLTGWPVIDLPPGQYIAICGIQEGESSMPHGLQGEAAVFTVEDPSAT